jgi:hypothetical protein
METFARFGLVLTSPALASGESALANGEPLWIRPPLEIHPM